MKCLNRNKQRFYYCLYLGKQPAKTPDGCETGESVDAYSAPVEMWANVSQATGTTQVEQFGQLNSYDKVIVTDDMNCPITETTVLFIEKTPELNSSGMPLYNYRVSLIAKSLNSISIAISEVTIS